MILNHSRVYQQTIRTRFKLLTQPAKLQKKQCGGVYFWLYGIACWMLIHQKLPLPVLLFSDFWKVLWNIKHFPFKPLNAENWKVKVTFSLAFRLRRPLSLYHFPVPVPEALVVSLTDIVYVRCFPRPVYLKCWTLKGLIRPEFQKKQCGGVFFEY